MQDITNLGAVHTNTIQDEQTQTCIDQYTDTVGVAVYTCLSGHQAVLNRALIWPGSIKSHLARPSREPFKN